MSDRAAIIRQYAELRPRLGEIRRDAIVACTVNPLAWIAVQGVPLNAYLAEIDKLDALCAQCEAEIAAGAGGT